MKIKNIIVRVFIPPAFSLKRVNYFVSNNNVCSCARVD